DRDGRLPGPRPNPAAQAPRESEAPIAPAPRAEPEKQKPRYDFYTLLRERETQVSDKELAEKVRAETARPAAPAPAQPQAARERYLLQIGALVGIELDALLPIELDVRDADAVKARIALAGLQARVETANVNGAPVHRVRLGPYATASELEAAKRQLAENGVPDTLAVREALD
ncbi:MAG TPA: SPOR domain-containing protein, partial [Chiayiivirga sp.]|nr:SPOR domain-containing protein [Chiayiivirga sp.]